MNRKFTFSLIVSILFLTAGAFGATLNVPSVSYPTIQDAINAANVGDDVNVADGTYTGTGNRDIDFSGKKITVYSASNDPTKCIIDCQFLGRGFYFYNGEETTSVVRGFTIQNGSAYYGGAIECEMSSPTIENCILTNNDAVAGGAIDCYYSSPEIEDCVITNNTADDGGAIETGTYSSPLIVNCLITSNTAAYNGGAIDSYDSSSPIIRNCTIADNNGVSNNKGGVYAVDTSHPTIANSILWNNGDDIVGATATYSCIQDGDAGVGNININPKFRTGPSGDYYLSQIAAGQLADSNCVNTGNNFYGFDVTGLTTKTNNGTDSGNLDMGYHYKAGGAVPQFALITSIDPNGNYGTLDPNHSSPGQLYNQFSEVQLVATPNATYTVREWTGTDDDSSTSPTNVVTMDADRNVTVSFISTTLYRLATTVIGGNGIMDNYPDPNSSNPTAEFPKHTQVTVNAYPTPGNVVKRWIKGNTGTFHDPNTHIVVFDFSDSNTHSKTVPGSNHTAIRFSMDANTTAAVEFIANPTTVLLDTRVIGGNGTLTPRRGQQPFGKIVALTAVPNAGYRVKAWSGDAITKPAWNTNSNTVVMTEPKNIAVEFEVATPIFSLTTTATAGATITPNYPAPGQNILAGTVVSLTATIPSGKIISWNGTDDDSSQSFTNTATMTSNHTVNVSFSTPRTINVPGVPPYITIQDAINQAGNGDIIKIADGTYPGSGFIVNKSITIVGNPGDPNKVVIDGNNFSDRIFTLSGGGTIVLNGLTIANAKYYVPTNLSGVAAPWSPTHFRHDGGRGGNALGAGIYMSGNHTITNCIIRNCTGKGGDGRDGIAGALWDLSKGEIPIHKGGYGGRGGDAAGSGIYIVSGNPIIKNTIVEGCKAIAGYGGGGGNGLDASTSDPFDPNYPGGPGGNGGDGGNALGAGIYCDQGANPKFTACIVRNCEAISGYGGDGGLGGGGARNDKVAYADPNDPMSLVQRGYGQGGHGGMPGLAYGGGIYIDDQCIAKFDDCEITENSAQSNVGGSGGNSSGNIVNSWTQGGVGALVDIDTLQRVIVNLMRDVNDPCTGGIDPNNLILPKQITINGTFTPGMTMAQVWAMITPISPEVYTAKGGGVYIGGFDTYMGLASGGPTTADFNNCEITNNWTKGSTSGMGGYNTGGLIGHHNSSYESPSRHYRVPSYGNGVYLSDDSNTMFSDCNVEGNYYAIEDYTGDTSYNVHRFAHDQFIDFSQTPPVIAGHPGTETTTPRPITYNPPYTYPYMYKDIYGDEFLSYGGGLCFDSLIGSTTQATVTDCNISDNNAPLGGGIYAQDMAIFDINNCEIADNLAYFGGGLFAIGNVASNISGCTFASNNANAAALSQNPDDTFGDGGGIFNFASAATISDCVITENTASGAGAGIYFGGSDPLINNPTIKNCLVTKNIADFEGGGIFVDMYAALTISNCTITDNKVSNPNGMGGGFASDYGSGTTILNSIIWGNTAVYGSQIGLGNGGTYYPIPSQVNIIHSDISLEYSSGIDLTSFSSGSGTATLAPKLVDSQTIYNEINTNGTTNVIVTLVGTASASASIDWSSPQEISALRTEVAALQNQVLATLNTGEFTLRQKLTNTAIFSGQVSSAGLNKLMSNSRVANIEPVRKVYPALAQAMPLANAMATRPSYNGSGISIAIVDTGVDYTHPRLGGGIFPNSKVIGGYDTGTGDSDPMPVGEAHGTCCAGIAAGGLGTVGDYIGGVAYNSKIYALKASPDDVGYFLDDATLAAWDWCVSHKNDNPANPILVMSNSWGSTSWFTNSHAEADAFSPAHTAAAQRAVDAGITILVCSQNQGQTNGICWPSAMSNVISVGAVYDTTDQVTEYSNTADILDILAPADPVYTTDIVGESGYSSGDYYPYFNGTSSACPFAAGSVAALQSAAKQTTGQYLTPAQVKDLLVKTGRQITDTKVAITKPRVDLGAAIASIAPTMPIYTEDGGDINGFEQDANDTWIITLGSGNIDKDPEFVFGYYLGRKKTGQDTNSPCIDAGSMSAVAAQLENYTTRLDGIFDDADDDANIVDMGYHYKTGIGDSGIYDITIKIIEDANYPGIHGTISANPNMFASHPDSATYTYRYYASMTPTFTAKPDTNDLTIRWYDANDVTLSISDKYTLTIDSNETIFVKFSEVVVVEQQPRVLHVPGDYQSLQYAINDSQDGDRIILAQGTYLYNDNNFDYGMIYVDGKSITIESSNPDDPCVVAATIIRGNGFVISNVDSTMVIGGITIQDAHYHGGNPLCTVNGPTGDGLNGGSIVGGAMELVKASPTIRNCRFVNCSATGGNGCPGTGEFGDGGWAGYAYGGAIGIDKGSSPYIKNCEFINCYARGGNAGDGATRGHGGNWGDPSRNVGHTWDYADGLGAGGGYMDYWYYGGRGGAIYVEAGGKAKIENCLFQGNRAESGHCGKSNVDAWPNYWYAIDAYGGAVYMAAGSEVSFDNCYFINNEADTRNQLVDANGRDGDIVIYSPVISFGGGIYAEGSAVPKISNCRFTNNRACAGGGMYWEDSTAYIDQSIFEDGDSMFGGGLAIVDSNSIIFNCKFNNNTATEPGGQGGGIYSASSGVKFFDCTFEENVAKTSGGGAYFAGNLEPNMHNCLIVNNEADRDGGGISANWNTLLGLSNCTITNNKIVGGGFASGFGGGISAAYEAYVEIINSIIWNNNSEYGKTISIGNIFEAADKYSAEVSVSYSNLQNGQTDVFVDTASGCQLDWGNGNLPGTTSTTPLFMAGYWGNFYLSQPTDQPDISDLSPCVNSGEGQAIDYDLFRHTTRTDHTSLFGESIDSGSTDMGYHYLLYDDLKGDFNYNGQISRPDLALFVEYWLEDGCTFPYFCHGRDLNEDGEVDYEDYAIFASNYGKIETTPPFPSPMTWEIVPDSYGDTVIAMEATTTRDNSGAPVMYNFVRYGSVIGDDHDYGWQISPKLTNSGLVYKRKYGYKVRAKDARGNLTGFSVIKYAYPGEHLLPPTPDPMTWAVVPVVISTSQITMTATMATDETPTEAGYGVEYYFDETSGNQGGSDSGWQASRTYTDTYLDANTTYTYRVRARDTSPNHNETDWSTAESATTPATGGDGNEPPPVVVDHTPPTASDGSALTPSGMWAITPRTWDDGHEHYNHYMAAVAAVDANSPPVRYYFECTAGNGTSSGWIVGTPNTSGTIDGAYWSIDSAGVVSYTVGEFGSANQSSYRIHIKDSSGNSGTEVISTTLNTW